MCAPLKTNRGYAASGSLTIPGIGEAEEGSGGERGIRTPGTRWVQQISSLPHSTTLPSLRGRTEPGILSGARDALPIAHIAPQGRRDDHRAIGLLVILENGDQRAPHGEA